MNTGFAGDQDNPFAKLHHRMRFFDWDHDPRTSSRPAAVRPVIREAGHMRAPDRVQNDLKKGLTEGVDAVNLIDFNARFCRPWWEHVSLMDLAELKDPSPSAVRGVKKANKKTKKKT